MPVALGLVDLGVLLALAFLIALSYAYRYSVGAAIVALANLIGSVRLPSWLGGGRILGFAADDLLKVDHAVMNALGTGIEALQATWNEAVSYTATAVHWVGKEIASLSHDTAQAVEGLAKTRLSREAAKEIGLLASFGPVGALLITFRKQLAHAEKVAVGEAVHLIRRAEHDLAVRAAGLTGALPFPRIGRLEREGEAVLKRLREIASKASPLAAIGLLIAALARIGLGWTRCSNVSKTGKQICGMNPSLLESLLADTLLIVGTVSLVEFAEGMQDVTAEVAPLIRDFWRAN